MTAADTQLPSLADIRARFIQANRARVEDLIGMREQMHARPDAIEPLRHIGDEAHKIAGVAATLGFREMGDCAMVIDRTVAAMGSREVMPAEARLRIGAALDQLIETMLN